MTPLLAVAAAWGAEPLRIEELDLGELLGTVSAASRKRQSVLLAPAAVTVIERDAILRSGARTVPELLRTVPGVQVYRSGPGNTVVSLRGMGGRVGNNVVVLLDGTPLNQRLDGSVDWGAVPVAVEELERIEVARGPVSTLYGANAYTGVVSLVSRRDAGLRGMVAGMADDRLSPGAVGSVAYGTAHYGIRLYGRADATRSSSAALSEIWPDARLDPWTAGGVTAYAERRAGPWTWSGELAATETCRTGTDYLVLEPLPLHARSFQVSGSAERRGRRVTLKGRLEASYWSAENDPAGFGGFNYGETQTDEAAAQVEATTTPWDPLELRVGGRVGTAWISAPWLFSADDERTRAFGGAWASGEWAASPEWVLSGGVRVDQSGQSNGPQPSWRATAVYHQTRWSARFAVSSAWREPSYVELAARFVDPRSGRLMLEGDPLLQPPRVRSGELGLVIADPEGRSLQPTVFVQQAAAMVTADFASVVHRTYGNVDGPLVVGAEIEARPVSTPVFSATGALTAMQAIGDDPVGAIAGVPAQNAGLTVSARIDGGPVERWFEGGAWAAYGSGRRWDTVTGIPPTPLATENGPAVEGGGSLALRPDRARALAVGVSVSTTTAPGRAEGPFPWTAERGHVGMLFVRYARDREAP